MFGRRIGDGARPWPPLRSRPPKRRSGGLLSGSVVGLLVALLLPAVAAGAAITEFSIPTPGSAPHGIATGPDGALWFTEVTANKIGRITTAGSATEFQLPQPEREPFGIAAGPDGALWFTESLRERIGRITTAGSVTESPIPPLSGEGTGIGIAAGPDGALWFTEPSYVANKIGRITTAGSVSEFTVPTAGGGPWGITAGPDGALWFTESAASKIGRITPAGNITEFPIPTSASNPLIYRRGARRGTLVHGDQRGQDRAHHARREDHRVPNSEH